jgi:hypothetical protein
MEQGLSHGTECAMIFAGFTPKGSAMRWTATAFLMAAMLGTTTGRAQEPAKPAATDEAKEEAKPSPDEKTKDEKTEDVEKPPAEEKPAKPLDEGLESLDPKKGDRDLLEEAIRGMRRAQGLIEEAKTTEETLRTQKQVVTDLDELIKQLQQQLQNPQSQSSSSKQQNQKQKNRNLANVERQQQKPKPQAGEKPEKKPGESEKAMDSTESQEQRARREAEEARRRKLNQDFWGHLPEHVRAALNNVDGEKYLPKYAEYVRQYYASLAEKSRERPAP